MWLRSVARQASKAARNSGRNRCWAIATLALEPPLRIVVRPDAVTVRLPRSAPRQSPAARTVRVTAKLTLIALWQVAIGGPTENR